MNMNQYLSPLSLRASKGNAMCLPRTLWLLLVLTLWLLPARMKAQTACAVYDTEARVLTFKGTPNPVLGENESIVAKYYPNKEYNWVIYSSGFSEWSSEVKQATKVVIEESFKHFPVRSCYRMFYEFTSLTDIEGLKYLNTDSVTSMRQMFSDCESLTSLDLSSFNTANVEVMTGMFSNCESLTSLDLSSFNTASVVTMESMFSNCSGLTSLNLSSFNTDNVTNMKWMFQACSRLTSLDLSNFNTGSVTNMICMFNFCYCLTSLDLSNFNTSKVTRMDQMFSYSGFTSLDLSSFNTARVTYMDRMFAGSKELREIYVSDSFVIAGDVSDVRMFNDCNNLPNYTESEIGKTRAHYHDGGYFLRLVGKQGNKPIGAQGNVLRADKSLELSDDRELEVYVPFTASKVCYSREFNRDEWQAIYLPFAIDVDAIGTDYEVAMINNFHEYQQEDGTSKMELEVKLVSANVIPANTLCLIRRQSAEEGTATLPLQCSDVAMTAAEETSIDCASLTRQYRFTGLMKGRSGFDTQTDYLMRSGALWQADADDALQPYRWYLTAAHREDSPLPSEAPVNRISIKVIGGGGTSAVKDVPTGSMNEATEQPIYDLQGRRLSHAPSRGVYIKNGRKYVK